MTGTNAVDDFDGDELLAMDFALGVLDRAQRRTVELRLRSDPGFRARVEAWQANLSSLDDETPAVAPPTTVWAGIVTEISPVKPPAARTTNLWNSLALWRGFAFGGALSAAIAIAQIGSPPVPGPLLVAALAGADGQPLLSVAYDPMRGAVVLTPATQRDDAAGKSPELWVIEGNKPPRSLGVIDIRGPNAHAISSQQLTGLQPGSVLAISIEPQGGSPTGQPTGPVVATGKLTAI
jgi:anti-sigma-K factor RskA